MALSLFQNSLQEPISTAKAFGDAVLRASGKFRNIVVLDAHYARFLNLGNFVKGFPGQYFDFGHAEQNMIDAAAGFTVRGKLPLVCSFGMFLTGRGWENIRNGVCVPYLNVKFISAHNGLLVGEDGAFAQALEDIAIMRAIPNMKVICPADAIETKQAVESMLNDFGPTYLRLNLRPVPILHDASYKFQLGKGFVYKSGTDVCIFATGTTVHTALEAANLLERKGISTMLVNISTIKPIDENLVIECAKQAQNVVTVEDHQIVGGLGSAVCEVLSTHYPMKVLRLGMDGFGESGKAVDLYRKYQLDGEGIFELVVAAFKE